MSEKAETKSSAVFAGFAGGLLLLAAAFTMDLWGKTEPLPPIPPTDPVFTNTAPVRVSAALLIKSDADSSGLDCYACHDEKKPPPKLTLDANNHVTLPKEHDDLVMAHGRNNRNDNCYNCHDPEHLNKLKTRDGRLLDWEQVTLLCASCHGPTYRDWEIGIHGRPSGYWDRASGAVTKLECNSCHTPHAPAFASLKPAPAPHPLRKATTTHESRTEL